MKVPITKEENEIANEEALYLYSYLRKKYANESIKDLDIILNSICLSLKRLIINYVPKEEREMFIDKIEVCILKEAIDR